jgi:hypothetical protein
MATNDEAPGASPGLFVFLAPLSAANCYPTQPNENIVSRCF